MAEAIMVSRGGMESGGLVVDVSIKNSNNSETFAQNALVNVIEDGRSLGVYNTGSFGRFYFIAKKGRNYSFEEEGNGLPYIDVTYNGINNLVINDNTSVMMIRKPNNVTHYINSNMNVMFSDGCNSVDVYLSGGGAGGGAGAIDSSSFRYKWTGAVCSYVANGTSYYNGGKGGNAYTNNSSKFTPQSNTNYTVIIGGAGKGGSGNSDVKFASHTSSDSRTTYTISVTNIRGSGGNTGGTTAFGGILSANGGEYGYPAFNDSNGYNGSGGYGAAGGNGGGGYGSWKTNFEKVWVYGYANAGNDGTSGYVILNNFTYK